MFVFRVSHRRGVSWRFWSVLPLSVWRQWSWLQIIGPVVCRHILMLASVYVMLLCLLKRLIICSWPGWRTFVRRWDTRREQCLWGSWWQCLYVSKPRRGKQAWPCHDTLGCIRGKEAWCCHDILWCISPQWCPMGSIMMSCIDFPSSLKRRVMFAQVLWQSW